MVVTGRKVFRSCFRIVCVVGVAFMVGYWVYKFKIEDRDIGVVDFVSLEENKDAKLPVVSLCFFNPFLKDKINSTVPGTKINQYLEYLIGEKYDEKLRMIDYDEVTINPEDYFLYSLVYLSNETRFRNNSFQFRTNAIFDGIEYYRKSFVKCFAVEMYDSTIRNVRVIKLFFDMQKILTDLDSPGGIYMQHNLHYPGAYLVEVNSARKAPMTPKVNSFHITIDGMEVLRRRNSHNRKCSDGPGNYDDMVLEHHIEKVGCRAPYQRPHKGYDVCNSQEKIEQSIYRYEIASKIYPPPCERIAKIDYKDQAGQVSSVNNETWMFYLSFPKGIKVITQSKEIDGHALLGNIGGYIGLFLGKNFSTKIMPLIIEMI